MAEPRHLHPADIADELERLSPEAAQERLRQLSPAEAAAVVQELDDELRPRLLEGLSEKELSDLVGSLPHDEAADVIGRLPDEQQEEVIESLSQQDQKDVSNLLRYRPDTAGGIMSDEFIALREEQTVGDCLVMLRGTAEGKPDSISYLYVTNGGGKLVGIVPLRDLVFRNPNRRIADLMNRDVKTVL